MFKTALRLTLLLTSLACAAESDALQKLHQFRTTAETQLEKLNAELNADSAQLRKQYADLRALTSGTEMSAAGIAYMEQKRLYDARFRSRLAERNLLRSRLAQFQQYEDRPQVVLKMGDSWDPRVFSLPERLNLNLTCDLAGISLADALTFLKDAAGVETNLPPKPPTEGVIVGQSILAFGALTSAVLLAFVLGRAIRRKERPQFSLRWLLALTIFAGLGVHGYIRWNQVQHAWLKYNYDATTFDMHGEAPIKLNVENMPAHELVKWYCEDAELSSIIDKDAGTVTIFRK